MSDDSTQAVVAGEHPQEPGNAAAQVSEAPGDQGKSMTEAIDAGENTVKDSMDIADGAEAPQAAGVDAAIDDAADQDTEDPPSKAQPAEQNGQLEDDKRASKEEEAAKDDRGERKRDRDGDRNRDKDRHREKDRKDRHRDRDDKNSRRDRDERRRSGDKDKDRDRDRDRERDTSSRRRRERSGSRDRDRDRDRGKDHDRSKSDRKEKRSSRHRSRSKDRPRRHSSRDVKSSHKSRSREPHSSRRRRHKSEVTDSSEDEFGGYVPRKRQEIPRPSKIKPATVAPGYSTAYIDPYAALRSKTLAPADPEELARTMQEQQLKARQLVLQQQAASAVAAASKTQREVYVGNLMAGLVTEDALRQLFNSTMRAAFPAQCPPGMEPVVSVSLHSEGRYAFVELRTPEMASAALQLSNQVQLLGQSISVGRPSGYVDPSRAQEAAQAAAAALQAFQAGDMQTMEAQLEHANLGATASPAMANPSPAAAGQVLPGPPAMAPPGAPVPAGMPVHMAPSVEPAAATPYLEVNGMVTPEVLMDDEEYKEVIQDLHEECGKYGQLLHVIVPRPPNPASAMELFGSNNYGKAFAQFADPGSCAAAKAAIHGRMFAGETIRAQYVTPQYFAQLPR